jgi:hypothetical protein
MLPSISTSIIDIFEFFLIFYKGGRKDPKRKVQKILLFWVFAYEIFV